MSLSKSNVTVLAAILAASAAWAGSRLVPAGEGYALTSVNTAVFRGSAVVSHGGMQYISYYAADSSVVVGRRPLGTSAWQFSVTPMKGNIADAHNVISLGVDGDGYLHLSFDHHGHPLRYCRSVAPGSLDFGSLEPMTGTDENDVTYPEFYSMPDGGLLFAYRSGASGNGNLVLKRYDTASRSWSTVCSSLLDGEGRRNAYWQLFVDPAGTVHLSWVWRESWLVETNHDLCYARSTDGGRSWSRSDGSPYSLPITLENSEIAWSIPQNSELINQTSMTADAAGHPYIATYWRSPGSSVPQYRLVWHDGTCWRMEQVGRRLTPFTLAGGGTKMIPIARPRIVSDGLSARYIFRDLERGGAVSIASTDSIGSGRWAVDDVTDFSVGAWEPNLDINLWNTDRRLHIYVQPVLQGDGERVAEADCASSPVYILEYE